MKKFRVVFVLLFFFSFNCFGNQVQQKNEKFQKEESQIDIDFRFYLPSLLEFVTGANPCFGLRENWKSVDDCFNFMIEGRGNIFSFKDICFSWSFGTGGYFEKNINKEEKVYSLNISLGAGLYYHFHSFDKNDLTGVCIYLYPMYQVPIYTVGSESYLKWRIAYDIGYTFLFFNYITVYPYMRGMIGFNSNENRYGLDFGVSIGIYFNDL